MISPEKIKLMRKLGGRATQHIVGAAIGLERSTYARREAAGDFSQAELEKMAKLLKCKVEDFFDDGARAPTEAHSDCRIATNDAMIQGMRETISVLREQIETQKEMIDMLKAQLSKKKAGMPSRYQTGGPIRTVRKIFIRQTKNHGNDARHDRWRSHRIPHF